VTDFMNYTETFEEALRAIYSKDMIDGQLGLLAMTQFCETWNEFGRQKGDTVTKNVTREPKGNAAPLSEIEDADARAFGQYRMSLTIDEYGETFGLTRRLRELAYIDVVADRVRTVARSLKRTQERLCQIAAWNHPNKMYADDATGFATLSSGDVFDTAELLRCVKSLDRVNAARFANQYVTVFHPDVKYSIMDEAGGAWLPTKQYSDPLDLYNNEIGAWRSSRFVESTLARLPNAGDQNDGDAVVTTLAANVTRGDREFTVASATGLEEGMEFSVGVPNVIDPEDSDYDPTTEEVVIGGINGTTITLDDESYFHHDHNSGDDVVFAPDIFPVTVMGPGALAYCVAVPPELVIAPPVDRLKRFDYLGHYGIYGYGIARRWQMRTLFVRA
jgi:N4-gp56 family major capsid protein